MWTHFIKNGDYEWCVLVETVEPNYCPTAKKMTHGVCVQNELTLNYDYELLFETRSTVHRTRLLVLVQ